MADVLSVFPVTAGADQEWKAVSPFYWPDPNKSRSRTERSVLLYWYYKKHLGQRYPLNALGFLVKRGSPFRRVTQF